MKPINLLDQQFGSLIVLSRAENTKRGRTRWNCLCVCGKTTVVTGGHLTYGHTRSCGCQSSRALFGQRTRCFTVTHGLLTGLDSKRPVRPREYKSWESAKARCYRVTHHQFHNYGGRGITMCREWQNDFGAFMRDMGPRPKGHTLDRRDNDGPYAPWNCKWSTPKEQAQRRRSPGPARRKNRLLRLGLLPVTTDSVPNLLDSTT